MSDTLRFSSKPQEGSPKENEILSLAGVKVRSVPKREHSFLEADQKLSDDLSQIESLAIERSTDPKVQVRNIYAFVEEIVTSPQIVGLLEQISRSQYKRTRGFMSAGIETSLLSLLEKKKNLFKDGNVFFAQNETSANSLGVQTEIAMEMKKVLFSKNIEDYLGISPQSVQEARDRYAELYTHIRGDSNGQFVDASAIVEKILSELIVKFEKATKEGLADDIQVQSISEQKGDPNEEIAVIDENIPVTALYLAGERRREEAQVAQPWLDQDREADFKKVTLFFSEIYELDKSRKPFKQWLVDQFNLALPEEKKLDIKDMSSVVLQIVKALGAGEVAGQDIERPVITFLDSRQYFEFMDRVSEGMDGSALYMQFNGNEDNIFARTGFIFTSRLNDMEFAHEIRHTIDPYVKSRTGADQILTEAFAFFQANQNDRDGYIKLVRDYYVEFGKSPDGGILPQDEFNNLVMKVIDKILQLAKEKGPLDAQRLCVQSKTINELMDIE